MDNERVILVVQNPADENDACVRCPTCDAGVGTGTGARLAGLAARQADGKRGRRSLRQV